jgi:hypothetical protein
MHRITLFHTTSRARVRSILENGILPACSRGAKLVTWLTSASRRPWARQHVARRHNVPLAEVVTLRVSVDRSQLVRTGRRGVWQTAAALPASAIQAISLPAARLALAASV